MDQIQSDRLRDFLDELGKRCPESSRLYLLGGSALCLLGSPRPTLDIDYVGDDLVMDAFQSLIQTIASEKALEVEAVPIERFIPNTAPERSVRVGVFGNLEVFVFDPYSIALSKVDRGFDTDIDDVVFLIQHGLVNLEQLERISRQALLFASKFDLDAKGMEKHLLVIRQRMRGK